MRATTMGRRSDGSVPMRQCLVALLATLVAAGVFVMAGDEAADAAAPAPVILNDGSHNGTETQWAQTQQLPDDGGVRAFFATFLVQHAPGRTIPFVRADVNFDSTDDTTSSSTAVPVTAQRYATSAGGLETSRVTLALPVARPDGFSCPFLGGGRRSVDAPIRIRVGDTTGELSASTITTTVRFIEDTNCIGNEDFPRLTSASQNVVETIPGHSVTYVFSCADADVAGGASVDCDRAHVRWRRLNDGATGSLPELTGLNDDALTTVSPSFPSRGYYVVEAQLGNEDGSYPNTGAPTNGWWRLGNAVVNEDSASISASVDVPGASPSTPPSVNAGTPVSAVLTAADSGGVVQVIEWDADGNGAFERFEYTVPTKTGGDIVHAPLTEAARTQLLTTTTPGLLTVTARITDNGALDAADDIRRQRTVRQQVRVNAIPTASDVSASTSEDTPAVITLIGDDADGQPEPLVFEIVEAPPPAAGSVSTVSGNSVTFTPAPNFNGSTSFSYRTRDGGPATVAAHANSNIATVSITVIPVNDAPLALADAYVVAQGQPLSVAAPGVLSNDSDLDGDMLSAVLTSEPSHGAVALAADGSFSYTPSLGFSGIDSFTYAASDGAARSRAATVTIRVIDYRTDAQIRGQSGFVGDNVYNTTGASQTVSQFAVRGTTATYSVRIQNDSTMAADTFRVAGSAGSPGFTVRYLDGGNDVTAAVVAGTYTTANLPPGASHTLTVRVSVTLLAPLLGRHTALITATSIGNPASVDTVKCQTSTL